MKSIRPFAQPPRADGLRTAMQTALAEALDFMGVDGAPSTAELATASLIALAGTKFQSGDILDQHVDAAGDLLMRAGSQRSRKNLRARWQR